MYTKYIVEANMAGNFKNKAYSNTSKGSSGKDPEAYWYHQTQSIKQDRLIEQWLQSKGKSSNTKGRRASS